MPPSTTEITSDHIHTSTELPFSNDLDWIDVHYERDDSVKEATNPKSHSHSHKNNVGLSNSQRFSGNLKPGIIGVLPGSIQSGSGILGHSARRPSGIRIIPRKNGSKLTGGLDNEPGSPKVSCMGKVLMSDKSSHCRRNSKKSNKKSKHESNKPPVKSEQKGAGCLLRMARMFCVGKKRAMDTADESVRLEKERDAPAPVPMPVPGIGGIKKFASGRKVDWDFEEDTDDSEKDKEGKSSENCTDVNENDTPVPVLVLGLGGLKRFASGRKLDWEFEISDDEKHVNEKGDVKDGNNSMVKSDGNIGTQLDVPVLGIGMMKRFSSGRKVDWSLEVDSGAGTITKEDYKNDAVSVSGSGSGSGSGRKIDKNIGTTKESKKDFDLDVTDTSDKEKDGSVVLSVPGIGSMKRFASGRKADLISEMEDYNCGEAEVKHDHGMVKVNHAKQNKKNNVLRKELDTSGGSMNMFKSRRKMDWNVEVKGVRHRSAGLA